MTNRGEILDVSSGKTAFKLESLPTLGNGLNVAFWQSFIRLYNPPSLWIWDSSSGRQLLNVKDVPRTSFLASDATRVIAVSATGEVRTWKF